MTNRDLGPDELEVIMYSAARVLLVRYLDGEERIERVLTELEEVKERGNRPKLVLIKREERE